MKSNVGGIDRVLRIVAGLILIVLAATGQIGTWGYVGVIVLATGLFSFCGAYTLFGFSTCPLKTEEELKS
jgi:ABC-type branched-subunit amino acid transport system permease subunit